MGSFSLWADSVVMLASRVQNIMSINCAKLYTYCFILPTINQKQPNSDGNYSMEDPEDPI